MRLFLLLLLLVAATPALAQPPQQAVLQSGQVTPGHPVQWTTSAVVQDAGPASNGTLTGVGVQSSNSQAICINSAPVTGPYNQLCLGVNPVLGQATISLNAIDGDVPLPLVINVNGTTQTFPFGGGGGGGGGPILPSAGWAAGADIHTNGIIIVAALPVAYTLSGIAFRPEAALGATGTITVYIAPNDTPCSSGTNVASNTFDANGTPTQTQNLTLTNTAVPAGASLCFVGSGSASTWTSGASSGTITVNMSPT